MTHEKLELLTSKISLSLGMVTAGLTLADLDLILAITLKVVSIFSFLIVIFLNLDKLVKKVKEWFKW